ncbi:hypothetical protein OQA88_3659 [Cercophora sp. LCS_1]
MAATQRPSIQRASYYRENKHSPALVRARRPYLVKNAILGLGIFTVAAGIYAYTISVVGQDEFDDVKVPDAPVRSTKEGQQN